MKSFAVRSLEASHLRRRKYELVRQLNLPENLVGGSLSQTHRRCGKSNCHCATGRGHPMWSVTFSRRGKRRVERVPVEWVAELEQAVLETQAFLEAIKEVMAINIELLALTRVQQQAQKVRRMVEKRQGRRQSRKNRSTSFIRDRSSNM